MKVIPNNIISVYIAAIRSSSIIPHPSFNVSKNPVGGSLMMSIIRKMKNPIIRFLILIGRKNIKARYAAISSILTLPGSFLPKYLSDIVDA
jgi:hypothetical protein